ncbi:FtsX-like permease family protein [Stigmatella sp. ncwal1]|uniref:FtsX-like permease family protein n=1 Tax=Stigmatella ashevillensis TaxID=2995309 RepID=A0ABT5D6Y9_9BACT|nr:FtsX-like permease family protein [Stigmatella ashevillena]MDC0708618.1 FtsX-like permease family protein [Stigmatella ashevillena]
MTTLLLLLEVAFRNLFKSWVNLIIGGIIFFATFLVVTGGALLDSIDSSMSRSIVGSLAGHLQVYSDKSKDELSLFGGMSGEPDVAAIDSFTPIKQALEKHPNVQTVVPMGSNGALISSGNTVDLTLARLRDLYRKNADEGETPERRAQIDSLKAHVRRLGELLQADMQKRSALLREESQDPAEVEALERVRTDAFWADFDKEPFASLEFLENRLAPQAADGDLLYIRYVGTDLESFQKSFDRMQIVDGQPVPPGKRGMLLSKFFYEESLKLKTARRLDLLKEAHEGGRLIAEDPQLQRWVSENRTQTREIIFQLDPIKAQQATERLQRVLGSQEKELSKLLSTFLDVNDGNLAARYEQFYAQLVPLLDLYRIRLGDTLTITAFTRTGYVQNVNVPIYGTYQFNGLEKSPLAGSVNLMDLVSFRELYGYLTEDKRAEIAQLQAKSGLAEVKRENAEDALFGEEAPSTLVAEATPGLINENEQIQSEGAALRKEDLLKRVYSKREVEDGMVLSAALILKDPSKLESTLAELQQSPEVQDAKLRVVSWQKAVGLIGQFVLLMKMVLWGIIVILFVVVLAIINNAVMMATLQRVREVGTMRAIGAQRTFILSMILLETVVLGMVFGGAGAGLGSGLISYLGHVGIPAVSEELYFFFSGPRLLPFLSLGNFITAFLLVVGVSIFSTLYPAFLATRVSPVTAMQTDE